MRGFFISLRTFAFIVILALLQWAADAPPQQQQLKSAAPAASSSDWWQHAVFYEIYPRSFKDSDGDGVGDLNGITSKLDYLAGIGIDAIWITPFYPSPQVDFGYDVSNYENVDPQFGTLADFDRLLAEAHKRNIKVVCDLVINHTSDRHRFFLESKSSRTNPKRDWYVWRDPKPGGGPPNNWASLFGGSAWTRDASTGQYYYHFFYAAQPDLNWRSAGVAKAMFDSVRFWLRRGVDGFRVDAIDTIFEDPQMRDNPTSGKLRADGVPEQDYKYTMFLPENHTVFKQLRSVTDAFGPGRVLVGETYPPSVQDLVAYYGRNNDEFHMPFDFFLLSQPKLDAAAFRAAVNELEQRLQNRPINYVLSNHDRVRAFDRFGDGKHNDQIAKLLILMLLTLRGSPFFYYGEEIGMKTTPPERIEDVKDPLGKVFWPDEKGRDGERTPMQWTGERNAGFSTAAKTWLPIPSNAATRNVATMQADPNSILNFFKEAVHLRRSSPAILYGNYKSLRNDPSLFAYGRSGSDQDIIVVLNMSGHTQTFGFAGTRSIKRAFSSATGRNPVIDSNRIQLAPFEAIVLEVK